jgi:hypothetical protein
MTTQPPSSHGRNHSLTQEELDRIRALHFPPNEVLRTGTEQGAEALKTSSLADRMNFAFGIEGIVPTAKEIVLKEEKEKDGSSISQQTKKLFSANKTEERKVEGETNPFVNRVGKFSANEKELANINVLEKLNENKAVIYQKLMKQKINSNNKLEVIKFKLSEKELPRLRLNPNQHRVEVISVSGPMAYATEGEKAFEVTLNFSDPQSLFHYCFTELFAQDEIQTMEFPLLLHLREYAENNKADLITFDGDHPEVILVKNAPRYGSIDTSGIYGNSFLSADESQLISQTKALEHPTRANILAMAALQVPSGMRNELYEEEYLEALFYMALTGFLSVVAEAGKQPVTINTGKWGSGAFGNDPLLIAIVQILSAEMAGVTKLNYHLFSGKPANLIEQAEEWIAQHIDTATQPLDLKEVCAKIIESQSFKYGASDGN